MSEQQQYTPTTEPRLLKITALVLGEIMHPETLAKIAKCSKTAHSITSTTLQRKMLDKEELCLMIPRLFPGIRNFPADKDVAYYHALLDAYFTPPESDVLSSRAEVCSRISYSMPFLFGLYFLISDVLPEMRSANGRKLILAAIEEWRAAMRRNPSSNLWKMSSLETLQTLENSVLTDFAVVNNHITSRFEHQQR